MKTRESLKGTLRNTPWRDLNVRNRVQGSRLSKRPLVEDSRNAICDGMRTCMEGFLYSTEQSKVGVNPTVLYIYK